MTLLNCPSSKLHQPFIDAASVHDKSSINLRRKTYFIGEEIACSICLGLRPLPEGPVVQRIE